MKARRTRRAVRLIGLAMVGAVLSCDGGPAGPDGPGFVALQVNYASGVVAKALVLFLFLLIIL